MEEEKRENDKKRSREYRENEKGKKVLVVLQVERKTPGASFHSQRENLRKLIKTEVSKEIIIYHQYVRDDLKTCKRTQNARDVAWYTGIEIRSKIDKKCSNDINRDQSESWEVYIKNDTKPAVIIDFNFSKLNMRVWRCHRLVSIFGTTFASKQILP